MEHHGHKCHQTRAHPPVSCKVKSKSSDCKTIRQLFKREEMYSTNIKTDVIYLVDHNIMEGKALRIKT